MTDSFQPSRDDGRSDRVVVYELVRDAEPGDVFTYDTIIDALSEGLVERPEKDRAHRAIYAVNKMLLQENKHYLSVIRGVGYRVIHAEEHLSVALTRKDQAQTYLQKGLDMLRHGQLMILAGVYQAVKMSEKRHQKQEGVINEMRRQQQEIADRLRKLEEGKK